MNTKPLCRKSSIEMGNSIGENHTISVLHFTSKIICFLNRTGKSELTKSLIRPIFPPTIMIAVSKPDPILATITTNRTSMTQESMAAMIQKQMLMAQVGNSTPKPNEIEKMHATLDQTTLQMKCQLENNPSGDIPRFNQLLLHTWI